MAIEQFDDGESGESIRAKINLNFVNLDDRLTAREEIDLPALLGLLAPPIVSQPSGGMVAAGSTRTLSVTTGPQVGQAPTLFQWQSLSGSEWSDIAGATSSTYTTPVLTEDVTLRVKLSNAFGDTYSTIVTVSVLGFAVQPQSGDFYVGNNVTFTATSNLSGASYRWQEWDGDEWQNITGATSGTYSVNGLALGDDAREFRCVISISGVQAISDTATITVFGITTQPTGSTTLEGNAITLSIATNKTEATYQWQRSTDGGTTWNDLAASTEAELAVAGSQANNGRRYRCVVMFRALSIISNSVTRRVFFVQTQPANYEALEGRPGLFSVVSSLAGATYQWAKSTDSGTTWSNVSSATNDSYATAATTTSDVGAMYRVTLAIESLSVTSQAATLAVWNPSQITALGAWIDPATPQYVERTGINATTQCTNNDPVGTMRARNTNRIFAASDAVRATFKTSGINGKPAFLFDGVDDSYDIIGLMSQAGAFARDVDAFEIHMVLLPVSKSAVSSPISVRMQSSILRAEVSVDASNISTYDATKCSLAGRRLSANATSQLTYNHAASKVNAAVYSFVIDAANATAEMRVNNASVSSQSFSTAGKTDPGDTASIALSSNTARAFAGYVGDVVLINRQLDTTERNKLEMYLQYKAGVLV